jgi:invasion protein IalB
MRDIRKITRCDSYLIPHLPTNIALPSVVRFAFGDSDPKPMELSWRRCMQVGCFADATLDDAHWSALRARSDNAVLEFTDASNRLVKMPITFRGFAQAEAALAKE